MDVTLETKLDLLLNQNVVLRDEIRQLRDIVVNGSTNTNVTSGLTFEPEHWYTKKDIQSVANVSQPTVDKVMYPYKPAKVGRRLMWKGKEVIAAFSNQ